ncbi:MAG: CBS domain-containing protein [Ignisphaera sp.]|nr:CBS domain-containing protein [Ignisphaera sp.]MCX8168223.1 CBS domain-containing protein [Ignisphaera sp.]MDW8084907.1 CBS domain-containing protein [Ignisphaera sp.]
MSRVADIASRPSFLLRPSMKIGEILPKMKELKIRDVPVVDEDNRIIGMLSYRSILTKGVGRDTKVQSIMEPPFYIYDDADVNSAVSSLVAWRSKEVPVINRDGVVVGIISRSAVLHNLIENNKIPRIAVEEAMSKPAITIGEKENIAKARWVMLKSGISRLPVVDTGNRVVGVITLSDIVERLYSIRLSRRKGYEWIQSEESFLAAPVSEFMTVPPITAPAGIDIVKTAVILLDNRISGVPVVTNSNIIEGVISNIDILRKYLETFTVVQSIDAKLSGVIEGELERIQIEKLVNSYLSKFSRYVRVIDFKLIVKRLGKVDDIVIEKRKQYDVSIRLSTNFGTIVASSQCWDLATCVREVLSILERRLRKILDKKGIKNYDSRIQNRE